MKEMQVMVFDMCCITDLLPNDKIDSKYDSKIEICLGGGVENIVGKGENAGNQHFLLFAQCFQNVSYTGSLKVGIVW